MGDNIEQVRADLAIVARAILRHVPLADTLTPHPTNIRKHPEDEVRALYRIAASPDGSGGTNGND